MTAALLLAGKYTVHPMSPPFFQDAFRKAVHAYPSLDARAFLLVHTSQCMSRATHINIWIFPAGPQMQNIYGGLRLKIQHALP